MFEAFTKKFPQVRAVEDSAARVGEHIERLGADNADCILSGLPWAAFNEELQDTLLDATAAALVKGGRFATFAYLQGLLLPSGQAFKRKLSRYFSEVATSSIAWFNLPPAFVYRCVK